MDFSLRADPKTYALILKNETSVRVQIGRWGLLDLQPGYYIYVGSAFGPGGIKARYSLHRRTDKRVHWHIDYLREHVTPLEAWVSYEAERLEHQWAQVFYDMPEMLPIQSFGYSACKCYAHFFHARQHRILKRIQSPVIKNELWSTQLDPSCPCFCTFMGH